jgi:hypothetical protein
VVHLLPEMTGLYSPIITPLPPVLPKVDVCRRQLS